MKTCPQCRTAYDPHLRICPDDGALLSLPDSYRLVGGVLDGKYRIDALVGLGGFGAVYSAWHLSLDRQVAFKILQPNVDFGIAKVLSSSAGSMVSRSIGTPAYASPEQWQHGAQIDGRADIYSLGVMLYEMLAGSLPFRARSVEELIQLKLRAAPPPLASLLGGAPIALDELLRRMMAVDPASRPQTAADIPALFDAACKPPSDPLEAAGRMRPPEIERLAALPDEVTHRRPPAPEPPREQRPVERVAPKPEVAGRPPGISRSMKRRVGMAASVLAVTAMIGYASWSQLSKQATNDLPPTGVALTTLTENLANGIKIELVKLPGGEFTMGSNDGDNDEKPPHRVKLSPFAIGKYEVTQRQWKAVMGDNPSNFKGDDLPVERVSWEMVQTFLQRLNGRYRLPTEAEWEYAARAGSQGRYSFGDDENELRNYAWFSDNSNSQTHPVGKLKPNGFGLFDMHGNVREWCSDLYDANYYKQSAGTDPQGPSTGTDRVYRGGGWSNVAVACRSADRSRDAPGGRYDDLGFRLVRVGP